MYRQYRHTSPRLCRRGGEQIPEALGRSRGSFGLTGALLADKGYDADRLLGWLQEHSITTVIPPKAKRKIQRGCVLTIKARSITLISIAIYIYKPRARGHLAI